MGSNLNFKDSGQIPLPRQSSILSLTFDEFQNTFGGLGKDLGSMNMDELLKNISRAEETQAMASSSGAGEGNAHRGNFQSRGLLTLPPTPSQKIVDEDWRDFLKESSGGSYLQQRQPTMGEMTLEEFLARAGVVGGDNTGFYGEPSQPNNNNTALVPVNRITENDTFPQLQQHHPWPQLLFPKQDSVDTSSLSPPPYTFSGGVQGRKCGGTLDKATERRHRRMIKNRESASRSRARKQASTLEMEAEIAKLKEELQKKEEEIVEIKKNQTPCGSKKRCLRRTMTNPW